MLLAHSNVQARKDVTPSLSGKVVSTLTVGLVNPGPTTNLNPAPERRMMAVSGGLLNFWSWHSIFWAFAGAGLTIFVLTLTIASSRDSR